MPVTIAPDYRWNDKGDYRLMPAGRCRCGSVRVTDLDVWFSTGTVGGVIGRALGLGRTVLTAQVTGRCADCRVRFRTGYIEPCPADVGRLLPIATFTSDGTKEANDAMYAAAVRAGIDLDYL